MKQKYRIQLEPMAQESGVSASEVVELLIRTEAEKIRLEAEKTP